MHERSDGAAQTCGTGWAQVQSPRALTGVVAGWYGHGGQASSTRDGVLGTYVPTKVTPARKSLIGNPQVTDAPILGRTMW